MHILYSAIILLSLVINISDAKSKDVHAGKPHLYSPLSEGVKEEAHEVEISSSLFLTTAYYDYDGAKQSMGEEAAFDKIDTNLWLRYGLGKKLEIRGGLRYRQNKSTTLISTNEYNTTSKAGLESYSAGLKYSFKRIGKIRYAIDMQYRKTTYQNRKYGTSDILPENELILGDDGDQYTILGQLSYYRTTNNILSASGGYRSPPSGLSTEVPYQFEIAWAFTSWAIYFGLEGIYSLRGDEYAANPTEKPRMSTGATLLFNSINREVALPYLGIHYAFDTWRLGFKAGQIIRGISTDQGAIYQLSILWQGNWTSEEEKRIKKFKEYSVEATVIKVSPRGKFIKIDQGLAYDIEKGMRFDIFQTDFFGGNRLIASGIAYEVGSDWAIIRLVKRYQKTGIKKGFVARGY